MNAKIIILCLLCSGCAGVLNVTEDGHKADGVAYTAQVKGQPRVVSECMLAALAKSGVLVSQLRYSPLPNNEADIQFGLEIFISAIFEFRHADKGTMINAWYGRSAFFNAEHFHNALAYTKNCAQIAA